jgi:hypothetical protein
MTVLSAFPGHAGRLGPLRRWRGVALVLPGGGDITALSAFPGHAGRLGPLRRWRGVALVHLEAR